MTVENVSRVILDVEKVEPFLRRRLTKQTTGLCLHVSAYTTTLPCSGVYGPPPA